MFFWDTGRRLHRNWHSRNHLVCSVTTGCICCRGRKNSVMALKQPSEDNSLENFHRLSDDDYWGSAHKGFDFSEGSSQSSLSSVSLTLRKNDDLNQYDLLRYDGLNEVAENKIPSEELLTSHIYTAEEVKQAQELVENLNPLELLLKVSKGNFEKKTLSAVETIRNIILGLEYNLTSFKGRREKIELMHAAVESHDGNAILVVVMFLKNTLKKSIFQKEIGLFPDAVNMYLSYLYGDHEIDELTNTLLLLNKPDDAAMLKYDFAILVQDPNRKKKIIENCLKYAKETHSLFTCGSVHRFYHESVWEHKICLEDQIVLKDHKVSSEENSPTTAEIFTYLTGKTDLLDSSVTCNLIFSLLYFVNVAKVAFINAEYLKARYKLSQNNIHGVLLELLQPQRNGQI
ncbi:spermatogenesis-defective protein 39 [Caerostris extrusa]|uniref:Spermatogenesis-defective protein 39 n=1 Tax=Caerostris extrusa TaxID=172846 RepID=A0AAV4X8P6_CAEEX|nr:spermatogenesis-defective protein 39 [Caerostris extrusa]